MAYANVQFIAYVIETASQLNGDGSQTYLGLSHPQQDIEARCGLMRRAMETARDALPKPLTPELPGTTLKVFMAPAFFFGGATGAYQIDDVQQAITALQSLVADAQWQDWAFVLGSVAGSSLSAIPNQQPNSAPLASQATYNFVPVQLGGVAVQAPASVRILSTALRSGVERVAIDTNPGGLLLGNVKHIPTYTKRDGPPAVNYDGAGVFDLAGITWCIAFRNESDEVLQTVQRSRELPGSKLIQLQLCPSTGRNALTGSVFAQSGGYVFNCDGNRATGHSALMQFQPPLTAVTLLASAPVSAALIPVRRQSTSEDVAVSSLFSSGAGLVNVYPPVSIPAQQTRSGKTITLDWQASADYQFIFQLIYNSSGNFVTLVCEIRSTKADFYGNNYYTPLVLRAQDSQYKPILIEMTIAPGSSPYPGALYCEIEVPGFVFYGNAFEFSANYDGPPPITVW